MNFGRTYRHSETYDEKRNSWIGLGILLQSTGFFCEIYAVIPHY